MAHADRPTIGSFRAEDMGLYFWEGGLTREVSLVGKETKKQDNNT